MTFPPLSGRTLSPRSGERTSRSAGRHFGARMPRGAVADITHPQLDEVTGTKFAVDSQIEQSEFAVPTGELQSNANGPDLLPLERSRPAGLASRKLTLMLREDDIGWLFQDDWTLACGYQLSSLANFSHA